MAKVALLIGVSEYEPGLNPLPAAVKDLDAMKEVLLHPEMGGFAESDIVLLKNPKRQEMEVSIETLFADRHKDDLLLLFFSGHGIKDDSGKLYLATSETCKTRRGELVRATAVSANSVHDSMRRSHSKRQVVILDSCFSGAFAEGLSAKDDGTVDIRTQLGGEGRAVLTSSSSTQYSFEQEGEELSLYTRFLVEGMKTGEADLDGDDMVSIDELHEYAKQKVQEVKPELKPEIYPAREGFNIRLSKVPQGDPRQKYQKEVARCGKRGELTIISRGILDTWRVRLGLSIEAAKALEDEVLEPYRRDFQQKLQRYEQVVTDVLQREGSINDSTLQELQHLQQVLELRNEDTVPIEAKVTAHLETHKQNLETYKQSFSEALRQEYPLGEAARSRLQQMQQQLALSDADVALIEAQITTEVETYRRNLQQYEQAFVAATQQEYPLSEIRRNELRQHQQRLGLTDVEIAPIEATVTTQIQSYHQKSQQYKEAFVSATQLKHQPGEATRTQLRQTWQTLELREADVKAIEAPILAQIETYQANLRRYEQAFADASEQEYPLSDATRSELRQCQQALNLSDEDIAPIENRITASVEERLQKRQQYEQVFSDSIQFEFPVSESTRAELRRFQQVLELRNEDVARLEEKVISQREYQAKQAKLQCYEQEFTRVIEAGYPINSFVRDRLNQFQQSLELDDEDVARIEAPLVAPQEAAYQERLAEEQRRKEVERQLELERQQKLEQQRQEQIEQEAAAKQRQAEAQERQRREAEQLKQKQAEAERLRQEELERQRVQDQQRREEVQRKSTVQPSKVVSERSTPTTPIASNSPIRTSSASVPESPSPSPTNRPNQPPAYVVLARRQFLKWAIPAGVGALGVTVASQFLGHQSPQSSTSSTQSPSATTVDYSRLEGFMKAGQWKEADQETSTLMLKVANREKAGYLDSSSIQNFPCEVLSKIDRLWVKYSNGHFGFSVQKKIWNEIGKHWDRFCLKVGWQNAAAIAYMEYSKLQFDPEKSPKGELPVEVLGLGWCIGYCGGGEGLVFSSLAQRLVDCNR